MNMDYMTLREASEKWGISTRQINYYCTEDRILGAVKMAGVWGFNRIAFSMPLSQFRE